MASEASEVGGGGRCPQCGQELGADSPQGMCAACLIRVVTAPAAPEEVASLAEGGAVSTFGDYELLGEMGHGGMGIVYRARQKSLNRVVALKMLLGGQFADPQARERFRGEAEIAAQLQHPNIVAIHEVGEREGLLYFTMDLVEGRSLAEVARERPLTAVSAATYLKTIAEAVQYAHEHGVLHRDLKPSNILIDASDQPRITDFGLAKRLTGSSADLTTTGQVLGSPGFIPPEQAAGHVRRLGPASDVYGLGATLYYLVTARPPFVGDNLSLTVRQVQEEDPVSPRVLNPGVPKDLETICLKCLQKDPGQRYGTAGALAEELGRFLRGEPIRARPVGAVARGWRWCRRRPAVAGLLGLLVVVSAVGGWRLWEAHVATEQELYVASLAEAHRHIEEGATDLAMGVLLKCPERFRHWEWGYLVAQCHREILTLEDAGEANRSPNMEAEDLEIRWGCMFSPDGSMVAAVHGTGKVCVWGVPSGNVKWQLTRPSGVKAGAAFVPDWSYAVWATKDVVEVIAFGSREPRLRMHFPGGRAVRATAIRPDGLRVAAADRSEVTVWDAGTGELRANFRVASGVERMAFSADGRKLRVMTPRQAVEYDAESGAVVRAFTDPSPELRKVIPDAEFERFLTFDRTNRIRLWVDGRPTELGVSSGVKGSELRNGGFSGDGRLLFTSGEEYHGWLREASTGRVLTGLQGRVYQGVFSPDNTRFASAEGRELVRIWDVVREQALVTLPGHQYDVQGLAFSPDGRLLASVDHSGRLKVWLGGLGRERHETRGFPWMGSQTPDGRWVCYSPLPVGVAIYDTQTGAQVAELSTPRRYIHCANISPNGRYLATASSSGRLCLWDLQEWNLVRSWKAHDFEVISRVRHSPDGRLLATVGEDEVVRIWDAKTGNEVRALVGHTGSGWDCSFSPDGKTLASGSLDGTVRFWDVATGQCRHVVGDGTNMVLLVRFRPDGRELASAHHDRTIRFWDPDSGQLLRMWKVPGFGCVMEFSPDGARLLLLMNTGDSAGLGKPLTAIMDTQTGRQLLVFRGRNEVLDVAMFSPDGRTIFTPYLDYGLRQREAFPWRDRDYPKVAASDGPIRSGLEGRIRQYARQYWQQRLAMEYSATSAPPPVKVVAEFTAADYPARDPATPKQALDLSPHYTTPLDVATFSEPYSAEMIPTYRDLPPGLVRFEGVPFDVRGVMQLALGEEEGAYNAWFWEYWPQAIRGIEVRQSFGHVHGLLAASRETVDGEEIGALVLHYADGEQRELPIVYGRHVRSKHTREGPNSHTELARVVWYRENVTPRQTPRQGRLYKCIWVNPRPEVEVVSVDFVSRMAASGPLIIALTVEPASRSETP